MPVSTPPPILRPDWCDPRYYVWTNVGAIHSLDEGLFPSSDHFPLGRAYGRIDTTPQPVSVVRPFGLTLAVPARTVNCVAPAELGYDEDAQVGLIRDGVEMVPLSKHTDGQTNTVTQGGNGQATNKDSDTDHRED